MSAFNTSVVKRLRYRVIFNDHSIADLLLGCIQSVSVVCFCQDFAKLADI